MSNGKVNIDEFMRAKIRKSCPVCQLPDEIRSQLGSYASKRRYTREDQLEWLRSAVGVKDITMEVLVVHLNSRHDQEGS